jgi:hypothetical protein
MVLYNVYKTIDEEEKQSISKRPPDENDNASWVLS